LTGPTGPQGPAGTSGSYTAGSGITITGAAPDITISADDGSPTNELNTSLSVTGGNLRLTDPGGNLDVAVSDIAPVQAVAAGAGISITGTTTRTIASTITQGLTTLNSQTGTTQTFATGTTGTDFAINSATNTHTFNLPSSSASNRGLLLAADWSTFNNKIGGSGAAGQIPYMSASTTITTESGSGANNLAWNASDNRLGIGTAGPYATLHVQGSSVLFQNSGPLSLTLNDASNGYIPTVYFQQGGTTRATIEAGVGLSAGLFFSSGVTRLMSFGYGTASSSKFGRTYAGNVSGPVDGIAVEGLSGFGSLAPTSRAHINGANGYTQFRIE
jgi:hypothetical protein